MKKLDLQTPDLTEANIAKIAQLFPQVVTEAEDEEGKLVKKVDFDLLRQELSKDIVEDTTERYRLDRPGKKRSLLKANTPITKTLRPVKADSVNWDTTENLYLEGDNFEILKILQESYLGKIKMIYIDPPYNTGRDFVYKDNFIISKDEYEDDLGVKNEEGGKLFRNTDSNGRYHSDWLSMMYERLTIARDLLKDDGVVFVSIDDNEITNLKKISDEIFGEENVDISIRNKVDNDSGKLKVTYRTRKEHEYIIIAYKNMNECYFSKYWEKRNYKNEYTNPDNDPRGPYKQAIISDTEEKSNTSSSRYYDIKSPSGKIFKRQWRVEKEEMDELINDNRIYFGIDGNSVPSVKAFINEEKLATPSSLLLNLGTAKSAGKEVNALMGEKMFDYPKPTTLVKYLINIVTSPYTLNPNKKDNRAIHLPSNKKRNEDEHSLILDFFSGSATTAEAVIQLNIEDGGNRKFIMAQLPEETDPESEAYKAGYKYITEIGKERIRRAGKKILEENKDKLAERETPLDTGFRVYKTDTSNMKDVYYHPSQISQEKLGLFVSNVKDDRTPEDLLTQVMLDLGLTLDLSIEEKKIKGNKIFFVSGNSLVACFDEKIDIAIMEEAVENVIKNTGLNPLKIVLRDSSFSRDDEIHNFNAWLASTLHLSEKDIIENVVKII